MATILPNGKPIYMDDRLHRNLLEIRERNHKKDKHYILIIDGDPGTGKSTLGQQCAFVVDDSFAETASEKIQNEVESFMKGIVEGKKKVARILDEGLNGANARRAMSALNIQLQSLLAEIRQKNLLLIICVPFIFDLDRSVAIGLSDGLIHCYEKGDGRRYFKFYGKQAKKRLYLNPQNKKFYTYNARPTFWGRFSSGYVMNEEEYRKFKEISLKKYVPKDMLGHMKTPEEMVKEKEALMLKKLRDHGFSLRQIEAMGFGSHEQVRRVIKILDEAPVSVMESSTNLVRPKAEEILENE